MPAHQRLWPDKQHCREDRREPAIELDKEQAVAVVEPDATPHSSLQHNQLLPEGGIFRFKSAFGLEDCCQKVEDQGDQGDHHPKRDVIPSPVQCGRGFRYTHPFQKRGLLHVMFFDIIGQASPKASTSMPDLTCSSISITSPPRPPRPENEADGPGSSTPGTRGAFGGPLP